MQTYTMELRNISSETFFISTFPNPWDTVNVNPTDFDINICSCNKYVTVSFMIFIHEIWRDARNDSYKTKSSAKLLSLTVVIN